VVREIEGCDVVDGQLHSEASAIDHEESPHPGVAAGCCEGTAGSGAASQLATCAQLCEVAVSCVPGQHVIGDSAQQHRYAWHEHSHAPSPPGAHTQTDKAGEEQRHHNLRNTTAQVA